MPATARRGNPPMLAVPRGCFSQGRAVEPGEWCAGEGERATLHCGSAQNRPSRCDPRRNVISGQRVGLGRSSKQDLARERGALPSRLAGESGVDILPAPPLHADVALAPRLGVCCAASVGEGLSPAAPSAGKKKKRQMCTQHLQLIQAALRPTAFNVASAVPWSAGWVAGPAWWVAGPTGWVAGPA